LLASDGEENNVMTVVVRSSRLWISAFRRAVSKWRDGLEVVQQQQRARLGYAAAVREEEDEYQEYPWANAGLEELGRGVQWVFLGCPGVGKGTYASRLAKLLQVPHIAMGDLVRQELSYATPIAKQVSYVCLSLWFLFLFLAAI
jgi:2-phosphoglycerate kinase